MRRMGDALGLGLCSCQRGQQERRENGIFYRWVNDLMRKNMRVHRIHLIMHGGADTVVNISRILVLAFGLRAYDLETNPPALFEDELAGAASAWDWVAAADGGLFAAEARRRGFTRQAPGSPAHAGQIPLSVPF